VFCLVVGYIPCHAPGEHFEERFLRRTLQTENEKLARMCLIAEQRLAKDPSSTEASSPTGNIVRLGATDLRQVDWDPSQSGLTAGSTKRKGLLDKRI
jgi:hypothetical protein